MKNVTDWKEIYDFNVLEPTFVPESHSVFADQALASHLFTLIQRFLIVAVIGVAVVESRKNYQICQLKKSVQLKDEVLSSMQQKLDNLCEQLKEHSFFNGLCAILLNVVWLFLCLLCPQFGLRASL
ncbi:inactive rhomboid protein [Senna tora]|uniref:Inactive rhomboid protein n=1 Tax=Senna tora TaxID=362788 RepID=A0A834WAR8_9FABA|nr:inactive rhomboid protein [Senna tora]